MLIRKFILGKDRYGVQGKGYVEYGVSLVFELVIPFVTEQLNYDCYYEWSDLPKFQFLLCYTSLLALPCLVFAVVGPFIRYKHGCRSQIKVDSADFAHCSIRCLFLGTTATWNRR